MEINEDQQQHNMYMYDVAHKRQDKMISNLFMMLMIR